LRRSPKICEIFGLNHDHPQMPELTSRQLELFSGQGFLRLEAFLPAEVIERLIADIEDGIARGARASFAEGKIQQTFDGEPFERRLASIERERAGNTGAGRHVLGKNLKTAGMFALMTYPPLLDLVESLIGPEILSHPQFNTQAKMPNEENSKIPWHQDLAFLDPDAEETLMVNFWIPLVDATLENGCLEVIPGSHRTGLKPHGKVSDVGTEGIADRDLPSHDIAACPVNRGGAVMFTHKLVHRSRPNLTDKIRWSVDIRFSDPREPTGRDNVPGFLARSVDRPAEVAKSHLDWLALTEGL